MKWGWQAVSRPEPALSFVIFSTLTLGLYQWYWGWRAWATLRSVRGGRLNATLRAAFGGFTVFWLVWELKKVLKERGVAAYWAAGGYLAVSLGLAIGIGYAKPLGWWLLGAYLLTGLAEGLVLLPVHQLIARVWREHPKLAKDEVNLAPNRQVVIAIGFLLYLSLMGVLHER